MPSLLQGYFLASFLFMAIVFSLPICLGLSALALDLPVGALLLLRLRSQSEEKMSLSMAYHCLVSMKQITSQDSAHGGEISLPSAYLLNIRLILPTCH